MKSFIELVTEIKKSFDQEDNNVLANIENSIELTSIATVAHATDSYLIYNKKLYKVIDDIAVGDTLVISPTTGANIEVTNDIMSFITSLSTGKENKATILSQVLAIGNTSVTFTGLPTTGNHLIDFFTSNGINYTEIDTSTAGEVTLTYDEQDVAVTVYCKISEV